MRRLTFIALLGLALAQTPSVVQAATPPKPDVRAWYGEWFTQMSVWYQTPAKGQLEVYVAGAKAPVWSFKTQPGDDWLRFDFNCRVLPKLDTLQVTLLLRAGRRKLARTTLTVVRRCGG